MVLDAFNGLPMGAARREPAEQEKVPVVEVANEVIWVNPAFQNPDFFHSRPPSLIVGQPTNLGMFAGQIFAEETNGRQKIAEGTHEHGRSLIIGSGIFRDNDGRLYRDIDAKGIGHISATITDALKAFQIRNRDSEEGEVQGIFDQNVAQRDAATAEAFISKNIRTYRVISIIKLKELIYDGEKCLVGELKSRGVIPPGCIPVISIRAFGTRDRIGDVSNHQYSKSADDARLWVAQEMGKSPQEFGRKEYFHWLVETLAENVARMHMEKLVHGYLSTHNITLDCRIVDLDSVHPGPEISIPDIQEQLQKSISTENFRASNPYANDLYNAKRSLDYLFLRLDIADSQIRDSYFGDFKNTYIESVQKLNQMRA